MTFRPGDEIEIKVTVESVHPTGGYHVREPDGSIMWLSDATLAAGRLLPRPIGVGDRVKWGGGVGQGTVVYIRDQWVVVDQASHARQSIDRPCNMLLSDLSLDKG